MALSITVTGDAILGYNIVVNDADLNDRIRVIRRDTSGHYDDAAVRGIDMVAPTGAEMAIIDYEAPFNTELVFIAEAYAISDLETPAATAESDLIDTVLPSGFAIITDPIDASLRIYASVSELDQWDHDGRVLGEHRVLGRRNPVINMDVESGRSGTMILVNIEEDGVNWDGSGPYLPYTIVNHVNYRRIFATGRKLLFRNTWYESDFDDMYFAVLGRSVGRASKVSPDPLLSFSIQYKEQDRPGTSTSGLGLGTWDDVAEANATWDDVAAKHTNWNSVYFNPSL